MNKLKIILKIIHTIFPYFHSLYLWYFYRDEWEFISEKYIGRRQIPESSIVLSLYEETWKHKKYGYIHKKGYLI